MTEERKVINIIRKEKQNSLELGKPGRRYKFYFETFQELRVMLDKKLELDIILNKLEIKE